MRSFNPSCFTQVLRFSALIVTAVFSDICIRVVNSISLDSNGYYDIVVAISEKTAQQDPSDAYINQLKRGIQDLSDVLFESTKGNFSIRSADIVLPGHWLTEADGYVQGQSFENADIRISHEYEVPQAINPVLCAYPGHYIEIPSSFFHCNEDDNGSSNSHLCPYGPIGKALLTLWARYRWGIHEEHGFPGDSVFPYFWKERRLPNDPDGKPDVWKVTNCANAEVHGKLEDLDGAECVPDPEDADQLYPPPSDCRFHPFPNNQTATSSLMGFQFIKTLLDFCDEETHNKRTPNRQNFFCQFKSAWEVIRETPDWKFLDSERHLVRTRVEFKILKPMSSKPLLFILSDGVNKPSTEVISSVSQGFEKLFAEQNTRNWNVLTSLGVYPGRNAKDSYDALYNWNFPWFERARFISLFEESLGNRTGFRNFGAAIQDVANRIKSMSHKEGAIILIIKSGSETNTFRDYFQAYESEVLGTILEQNIRVFALEGRDSVGERLKNLVELTKGLYFKIGEDVEQDETNIAQVFDAIEQLLEEGAIPPSRYRVAFKEVLRTERPDSGIGHRIPISYENVKKTQFYFHELYPSSIRSPKIIKGPSGISDFPIFNEKPNWAKTERSFKTYVAELNEPIASSSEWEYTFDCTHYDYCFSILVIIVELDETVDLDNLPGKDISISVHTSVELESIVDIKIENPTTLKGSVCAVFAKLEKNGHPINSPDLEVKAHIIMFRQSSTISYYGLKAREIILQDDGMGSPDITANDGIFSGSYIPSWDGDDGVYQIFVTATLNPKAPPKSNKSPMPIEQELIRCGSGYLGCWSETVTEPFFVFADLKRRIEFRNSMFFSATPFRVVDLKVAPVGNNAYELSWTEPIALNENGMWRAESYEVFYTEDFFNLFGNGDGLVPVYGIDLPNRAGNKVVFKMEHVPPEKRYYFAMKANGPESGPKAIWSNVIFLQTANPAVELTTSRSTSAAPTTIPSTETTTRLPFPSSTPSTAPTLSTTKPTTTPTTRRATRRTTRMTTTVTSTTTRAPFTEGFKAVTSVPKSWHKSTEAVITFSAFAVATVAIIGGVLIFLKVTNRG